MMHTNINTNNNFFFRTKQHMIGHLLQRIPIKRASEGEYSNITMVIHTSINNHDKRIIHK